ncbi:MAG: hypothetical protein COT85_00870 [Chlamydiae bacterium CG10_big_fil_rev_8_21_14_0_10_42_34]|nr:MAG: hypothetical protein COT85_00870 [Chlamydiae bacterium CG10_big_fil_rev_8_21_14_0_10_42_34]
MFKESYLDRFFLQTWVWGLLFISIAVISVFTSFHPHYPNLIINILIPLFFFWLARKGTQLFVYVKIGTLIIPRIFAFAGFVGYMSGKSVVIGTIIFLAINILEAAIEDLKRKHYFSLIIALLLMLCCVGVRGVWEDNRYVFVTSTSFIYFVVAYVIWNCNFILNQFSKAYFFFHLFVHAIPLLCAVVYGNVGYYLVFRAVSLLYAGQIHSYAKTYVENYFVSVKIDSLVKLLKKKAVQVTLFGVNTILVILYFVEWGYG